MCKALAAKDRRESDELGTRKLDRYRLLEVVMESAPQLVLQIYIMTQMTSVNWLTGNNLDACNRPGYLMKLR